MKSGYYLPLFASALIGLILASFFDADISQSLYFANNTFSIILASFGEIPFFGIMVFASFYLLRQTFVIQIKKVFKYGAIIILVLLIILLSYLQGRSFCNINSFGAINTYLNNNKDWLGIIIGLGFATFIAFLQRKIAIKNDIKLFRTLFQMLLIVGICYLVVFILKHVMHRPRYRLELDEFVPWYKIFSNYEQYIALGYDKEQFYSFPSGHVVTSLLPLMLCSLIYRCHRDRKVKIILIISYFWPFLMGLSRLMCGAHYLSDLSFSLFIATCGAFIFNEIINNYKVIINHQTD